MHSTKPKGVQAKFKSGPISKVVTRLVVTMVVSVVVMVLVIVPRNCLANGETAPVGADLEEATSWCQSSNLACLFSEGSCSFSSTWSDWLSSIIERFPFAFEHCPSHTPVPLLFMGMHCCVEVMVKVFVVGTKT